MTAPEFLTAAAGRQFDVGVAVLPLREVVPAPRSEQPPPPGGGIAGFEETKGTWRNSAEKVPFLIEKGEDAVRTATEAIAGQISLAAQRLATSIGEQMAAHPAYDATLDLESVSISFGVTLTVGVQAMFTAQAESSAQVTVTLSRRQAGASPAVT